MAKPESHAAGLRRERVLASPRFSDGTFHNTHPVAPGLKKGTTAPTLKEFLCGGQRRTPPAPLPAKDPLPRWQKPSQSGLRATWLGHSTVVLEIDGARVVTDPVWSERTSPVRFAGPRRFQPVPVAIAALPPIDAVVLSHDHYDHLDLAALRELSERKIPIITALGVGAHLAAAGVAEDGITELDWWEEVRVPGTELRVTAAPSQHFSGRGLGDRNRTLWASLALRGPRHSVFFSGDTGLTPEHGEIRSRLGPFDLIMLEVGAFHPAWGDIHLGPENALAAHALLTGGGSGAFLPVHWGTFNLALHAWDEPAETLVRLASGRGVQLVMPQLGEPVEPSQIDRVTPWWRAVAAQEKAENKTEADTIEAPAEEQAAEALPWPID